MLTPSQLGCWGRGKESHSSSVILGSNQRMEEATLLLEDFVAFVFVFVYVFQFLFHGTQSKYYAFIYICMCVCVRVYMYRLRPFDSYL